MKVIDLFCGCGGFSLGFRNAGFKVKYAIDNEENVKKTYEYNHPDTEFILEDIHNLDPMNFKDVDIIIGSPPCQDFSIANSLKNPKKGMVLVREFLKWVSIIKPKYWIMENVPLVKKHLKKKITNFNIPRILVLNSANYGVPQKRKRCFAGRYIKPTPTHNKLGGRDLFGNSLRKWKTVRDSIADLLYKPKENNIPNHNLTKWLPIEKQKNKKYMDMHKALSLDKPSRTILSDGGKNILHPCIHLSFPRT